MKKCNWSKIKINKQVRELKELCSDINVWESWKDSYNNYVPKFIEEAKKGGDWKDWDTDIFDEFFIKSSGQCVSSLQQGYFTNAEKDLIKDNWIEIAPLLKNIAYSQDKPLYNEYNKLKEIIRKYTSQNRKAATNRLIASLQPNLLCTVINENRLWVLFQLLNKNIKNFNLFWKPNWFENSYNVLQFFKTNLHTNNAYEIITLPWQVYDNYTSNNISKNNDMSVQITDSILDLLQYKKQIILQGPPGTGKTREAKLIAKEMLGLSDVEELKDNEQFKLIQFHPSYTYEDFVRGIVAKPNENGISYEVENKVLGKFAETALYNYFDSKKEIEVISKEKILKNHFNAFVDYINEEIDKKNGFYSLTNNVGLILGTDEDAFRYKGKNEGWLKNGNRMLYKDIIQAYSDGNNERQDIKKNQNLSGLARQHASYFVRVLNLFQDYLQENDLKFNSESDTEKIELKNYILIIDEINRANLSSVLGELIYALEYRGKAVESMYEVEGENKLILPPNLYIIGTMNTADRSVGHIDYAIRRRFAFVDILPKDLSEEEGIIFHSTLFHQVSELFETSLSPEFEKKDVQLGHSYFIQKKEEDENGNEVLVPNDFNIRLEYEIKPILLEYVKDGILKESAREVINSL